MENLKQNLDIVIIGKNSENTIRSCIDNKGLFNWPLGDVHIYYIDSQSNDYTVDIVKEYPHVNIHIIDKPPHSAAKGRNTGARLGSSPYIQFIDSDVVLDIDWLPKAAELITLNTNVGAVRGSLKERYPDKNIYHFASSLEWDHTDGECQDFGGTVLIKREVFNITGGYKEIPYGEDPELSRRIFHLGYKIKYIKQIMGTHDIKINNLYGWLKRAEKTGWAYAFVGEQTSQHKDSYQKKERIRIMLRSTMFFALSLTSLFLDGFYKYFVLFIGMLFLIQPMLTSIPSMKRKFNITYFDAYRYSILCSIVIIPEFMGMLRYWSQKFKYSSVFLFIPLFFMSCQNIEPQVTTPLVKNITLQTEVFSTKKENKSYTYANSEEIKSFNSNDNHIYQIGPGDVLSLYVWNRNRLDLPEVTVGPDGQIYVPRIGQVDVNGKTIPHITKEIKNRLSAFYDHPEINLRVVKFNNNRAFVLGRVTKPGMVKFNGPGTLLEALTEAGGVHPTYDQFKLSKCAIIRGQDKMYWIDLNDLLNGNISLNARIKNGDIIYIPDESDKTVYVMGEVGKPGIVRIKHGITVLDAIMQSGGFSEDANLSKTFLIRNHKGKRHVKAINIKNMIEHANHSDNYVLNEDDIIYIAPNGMHKFNYFIQQIIPSLQAINLGANASNALGITNSDKLEIK